ncbi:MAG: YraN family protein [Bacillota bacterium]
MRMGENTRAIGNIAENMAVEYLKNEGYDIVRRNFEWIVEDKIVGEIDIIAQKGDVVAIVEVKASTHPSDFNPSERVDKAKQNKIKKTAIVFSWEFGENWNYRFDIIEIVGEEIYHIEEAFI